MKKLIKPVKWSLLILFSIGAYIICNSLSPGADFYEREFSKVTQRKFPKSASFIEKRASYPDFHGDYCSSAQIKLSTSEYKRLIVELEADSKMLKTNEIVFFDEFNKTLDDKDSGKIFTKFIRKVEGEEDQYLFIGFYDDLQTIFVNVCHS